MAKKFPALPTNFFFYPEKKTIALILLYFHDSFLFSR